MPLEIKAKVTFQLIGKRQDVDQDSSTHTGLPNTYTHVAFDSYLQLYI